MVDIVAGVAELIAADGVVAYRADGTYTGDEPAVITDTSMPATGNVVCLTLYPGADVDGEESRNPWSEPRLQVRTRRGTDPRETRELDDYVHALLHRLGNVDLPNGVRLTDCYSLQSAALSLGQDERGRWELSRNYQLTVDLSPRPANS